MATSTDPQSNGSKPFRFKDLPAELRNQVYSYAVIPNRTPKREVRRAFQHEGHQPKRTGRPSYYVQPSIAFTQVCRLIRHKFQPIARANSFIYVPFHNCAPFLRMFNNTAVPSCKGHQLQANVILDLVSGHDGESYTLGCVVKNMRTYLLWLYDRYPSIAVTFTQLRYDKEQTNLDKKLQENIYLKGLFTDGLSAYTNNYRRIFTDISLTVSRHSAWMKLYCVEDWLDIESGAEQMKEFLDSIGFSRRASDCRFFIYMTGTTGGVDTRACWTSRNGLCARWVRGSDQTWP